MPELIDKHKAVSLFIKGDGDDKFTEGYNFAVDEYHKKISELQPVDVSERYTAQWVDIGNNAGLRCSECKYKIRYKNGIIDDSSSHIPASYYKYCPNCGRKMKKENEHG